MKKYLFGFLAIVLAIGFSAFTKPTKSTANVYKFEIIPGTFTNIAGEVADEDNWRYTGRFEDESEVGTLSCDEVDDEACEIGIDPQYISGTLSMGDLLSLKAPTVNVEEHLGVNTSKFAVNLPASFRVKKDYDTTE